VTDLFDVRDSNPVHMVEKGIDHYKLSKLMSLAPVMRNIHSCQVNVLKKINICNTVCPVERNLAYRVRQF